MIMSTTQQLAQTKHILNTIIEATDHFSSLIKNKEYSHSMFMFSSIVEGTQAVLHSIGENAESIDVYSEQIVHYLTLISNDLEHKRYTKVLEVLQFSLRPTYIKVIGELNKMVPQKQEKTTIGIYHRTHN